MFLKLIDLSNSGLSQLLLLFHHQLLPTLLSYISRVELLQLAFVVFQHAFLLFLCHALYNVCLFEFIFSFLDPGEQTLLLVVHLSLLVTLTSDQVVVVRVLLTQLRINLVSKSFLLQLNVTHSSVLFCQFQRLVLLECLLVVVEVSVGIVTKEGDP